MSLGILFLAFFFGSSILLAESLTYSTASSLIFLVYCYFGVILQGVYCRTRGVTRHGSVDSLVPGFLPSLFRGFLTRYWKTLSPLERPKSFQVLLALWVPNLQGRVVRFVNQKISPPRPAITKLRTLRLGLANKHTFSLQSPWTLTRRPFFNSRHTLWWVKKPCSLEKPCLWLPPLIRTHNPPYPAGQQPVPSPYASSEKYRVCPSPSFTEF